MIQFAASVRIVSWTWQLAELFAALSAWSLREQVDVWVCGIDGAPNDLPACHGLGLAMDVLCQGDQADDVGRLYSFLTRVLDGRWLLTIRNPHLCCAWDARGTIARLPARVGPRPPAHRT